MGKLNSMETSEEQVLADSLDTSMLDSFSAGKSGSAIDQTLDEIRSLRIIDQELAKVKGGNSKKEGIDQKEIEAATMDKIKKNGGKDYV